MAARKPKRLSQERSYFVAKDNKLIASKYFLSVSQQKLLLLLISRIRPHDRFNYDDTLLNVNSIEVSEIVKVCGYDSRSGYYYGKIKEDLKAIADASAWMTLPNGTQRLFRWLDTVDVHENNGNIRYSFHSSVAPFLFELRERYTQYSLFYLLTFRSKFSIRLYEYFCMVRFKGSVTLSLEEFKEIAACQGNYDTFINLRNKVIDQALKEINGNSDLDIRVEYIKTGRSISHIKFNIGTKNGLEHLEALQLNESYLNRHLPEEKGTY